MCNISESRSHLRVHIKWYMSIMHMQMIHSPYICNSYWQQKRERRGNTTQGVVHYIQPERYDTKWRWRQPLHSMKAYGRMKAQLHSFLTLAIDSSDWSASCPSHFNPSACWVWGWVGPTMIWLLWTEGIFCSCRESKPQLLRCPPYSPITAPINLPQLVQCTTHSHTQISRKVM
jgi:hypothetical protein